MFYPSAEGGGGDTTQRDDHKDHPLVPEASAVPLDNDPNATEMEVDHNNNLDICLDGEGRVHDDPQVEDSPIPLTMGEVSDEISSVAQDLPEDPKSVGNNDERPNCDNVSDVSSDVGEKINVEAVDEDSLVPCSASLEGEESMVEEEVNEYEAPVQVAVCGEDVGPELSEYEKLRERNIREREEMMKEVMEEINEAKQDKIKLL